MSLATAADDEALIRVLGRAFHDDPLLTWALRAGAGRERAIAVYFRTTLGLYRNHPAVFTIPSRQGCAIWAPPGTWQLGAARELLLMPKILRMLGLGRLKRGLSALNRIEKEHPPEPHYYLHLLGVDPSCQGRGHGATLVRAGLAVADRVGVGVHLETSNQRNLPLYQRHGFQVMNTYDFGPGTPTMWRLWRPRAR